ncbi:MAG TPA: hypothetical protein EYO33_02765 [Phycisphaerales bacterium]|nr:hypothetical protein [Phycisphaerales bacterium]
MESPTARHNRIHIRGNNLHAQRLSPIRGNEIGQPTRKEDLKTGDKVATNRFDVIAVNRRAGPP